jgi:predicted amidohydrolase
MRVACLQLQPEFGEPGKNMEKAARAVREAATQGARLAVLPELYTSGYVMKDRHEAHALSEPVPEGPSSQTLLSLSRDTGCTLVMGIAERDGEKVYNSCVVTAPDGYVGRYRKIHLFHKETEWYDAGESPPPVFDVGGTKIGLMICWDWIFPETARSLALDGAQIIAHPANLVLQFCQDAMITRCLENRVFAVTCNRIGGEERGGTSFTFTGRSQITGLNGIVLGRATADEEEILTADLEPHEAENKFATEYNNLMDQRRPSLYRT